MLNNLSPQPVTNRFSRCRHCQMGLCRTCGRHHSSLLAHLLLPDGGAQSIASIPLDGFTSNGAVAVIHIFAQIHGQLRQSSTPLWLSSFWVTRVADQRAEAGTPRILIH